METQNCSHEFDVIENKYVCKHCGKHFLFLKETDIPGIKVGIKSNGTKYTVRDNRKRYFYPDEWTLFYHSLSDKNKFLFLTLIETGARIDEALHIKVNHINEDRRYLTLYVTKIKSKLKELKPTARDISFSHTYLLAFRKYRRENNLKDNDFLFLNNELINKNNNKETIDKECFNKSSSAEQLLKRVLKKNNFDYYNFSLHNIRKTHGMWLKSLNVKAEEICLRLGHDFNTYLKHYGSSDLFKPTDKQKMINILGELGIF